jgi:hypothetical protein
VTKLKTFRYLRHRDKKTSYTRKDGGTTDLRFHWNPMAWIDGFSSYLKSLPSPPTHVFFAATLWHTRANSTPEYYIESVRPFLHKLTKLLPNAQIVTRTSSSSVQQLVSSLSPLLLFDLGYTDIFTDVVGMLGARKYYSTGSRTSQFCLSRVRVSHSPSLLSPQSDRASSPHLDSFETSSLLSRSSTLTRSTMIDLKRRLMVLVGNEFKVRVMRDPRRERYRTL